jgi:CHAD domain-containing protein
MAMNAAASKNERTLRSPAVKWLAKTIRAEQRGLERARRRFVRKPTEEGLHDVRTTGRRLRSLLEDASDLMPLPRLTRRVKRAATATDAARDATVLLQLLESRLDESERETARPLLDELAQRERRATQNARKHLRRACFES